MSEDVSLDRFMQESDTSSNHSELDPKVLTEVFDGWKKTPLVEVADSREDSFVDGPFGASLLSEEFHEEGFARIIKLQNIRSGQFIDTNKKYVTEEKFRELERHSAHPNEIAIAKMAEPVARACILPDLEDPYILAAADVVKLDSGQNFSNIFVMYSLNSYPVWKQAFSRARGTGRKRINLNQLKEVQIPTPPLPEQRMVATVLHTVDQTIEKTGEIIDRTERVKRGLMQKMYSRGYYNDNSFSDSVLGKLPETWEVVQLGNYIELISGAHVKSEDVTNDSSKTPYITGPDDFEERGFSVKRYTDEPTNFCEEGDILITVKGSGCGKSTIANRRVCISRQLKAIRPGEHIDRNYLFYYIRYKQNLLETLAEGSAIPGLANSHLTNMKVPRPSKEEQEKIGQTLSEIDQNIVENKAHKEQLRRIKQGLMQDLLSGTVRTTDTNIEVPDEVAQYG